MRWKILEEDETWIYNSEIPEVDDMAIASHDSASSCVYFWCDFIENSASRYSSFALYMKD